MTPQLRTLADLKRVVRDHDPNKYDCRVKLIDMDDATLAMYCHPAYKKEPSEWSNRRALFIWHGTNAADWSFAGNIATCHKTPAGGDCRFKFEITLHEK
jgi:hypothetical protein